MEASTPPVPRRTRKPLILVMIPLLLGAAFLAGWLPATLELRRTRERLEQMELELRLITLQRHLGTAAAEARRGNYGLAATEAGRFFDGAHLLVSQQPFSEQPRLRTALSSYVNQRDAIVTSLATSDPASAQTLTDLYLAFDGVLRRGL